MQGAGVTTLGSDTYSLPSVGGGSTFMLMILEICNVFRYDYEGVSNESANLMMVHLRQLAENKSLNGTTLGNYTVKEMDDFRYEDPVDKAVSEKQVNDDWLVNQRL